MAGAKKCLFACMLLLLTLVSYEVVPADRTDAKKTIEEGIYIIFNGGRDGECITVYNRLDLDETELVLMESNQEPDRLWEAAYYGDGSYTFKNCFSGRYMDLANGSMEENAKVWQYGKNGTPAQLWSVTPLEDGSYCITSKNSGKVLDIKQELYENIVVKSASQSPTQKWVLKAVQPGKQVIEDGVYTIVPKNSTQMALEVRGGVNALDSGTAVQIWEDKGNANQAWKIQHTRDGYYTIKAVHSGQYLTSDAYQYQLYQADRVPLSDYPNDQEWKILYTQDGYYYLECKEVLALDLQYGHTTNGSLVWGYVRNGTDAQKWQFYPAKLPKEELEVDNLEFTGDFIYYYSYNGDRGDIQKILDTYLACADQKGNATNIFLGKLKGLSHPASTQKWECLVPKKVVKEGLEKKIFTLQNYSANNLTYTTMEYGTPTQNTIYIKDFGDGYYNVACIKEQDVGTEKKFLQIGIGLAVTKR